MALRCLIVDDSEEYLASAARLLESQGLEVVGCATSSSEALRLAAALAPDVALIDVELGEEDGAALARELEARRPATRVLLISAHELEDLGDLSSITPRVAFLPKRDLGAAAIQGLLSS